MHMYIYIYIYVCMYVSPVLMQIFMYTDSIFSRIKLHFVYIHVFKVYGCQSCHNCPSREFQGRAIT